MIRDTSQSDTVVASSQTSRRTIILVASLLALGLLFVAYSFATPWLRADRIASADRIRIATVERGPFERSISVQGTAQATIRPTLYSPSGGVVTLHVRAGDQVEDRQLLAEVDNPLLRHQLMQEESRLAQIENELNRLRLSINQQKLSNEQELLMNEINLQAASRELSRVSDAVEKQVVPRKDLDVAQDDMAKAETLAEHGEARFELENDRLDYELDSKALEVSRQRQMVAELERQVVELRILSPTQGVVGNLLVDERDDVELNQPLLTVVNSDALEFLVSIPESFSDDIAPGMKASVNVQNHQIEGTLASVSPEVIDGHVEGRVLIESDENRLLKHGQRLTVRVVLDWKDDALTVSRGPFIEDGGGRIAYVVENDSAYRRAIEIGAIGASQVEVINGLSAGDRVVISSINDFEQADRVLIR